MYGKIEAAAARMERIPHVSPFSFCRNTTICAGGDAPYAFYPRSAEEFCAAVRILRESACPFAVLGRASNVLASDGGFDGIVLKTDNMVALQKTEGGIFAECGVSVSALLAFAAKNGCGGLHFLAGIPASVGGAVFMNAGAGGAFIGGRIHSVTALCGGETIVLPAAACGFSYKHSLFMDRPYYILGAQLSTERADRASVLRQAAAVLRQRRRLPRGKSMGCVFKNPEGASAGALIERAGLKGLRIGGAYVSCEHANFILNRGDATAAQIRRLIETVRDRVYAESGVRLEEEIRYIGEF